ncbi:unnamed protein product [Eruca vesicaria subsp. sativa]|uniref:peptidylprolyl isomerase n=1 Tax=Eruca vesicaria subsp. sativa TaxID=29727 RepID=A0ABC8LJ02_ERUVS|nr:unnamed protein product [Eruca vesicaria subsp. sativa]
MRSFAFAMKAAGLLVLIAVLTSVYAKKSSDVTELQIGVKVWSLTQLPHSFGYVMKFAYSLSFVQFNPQTCDIQAHKGDKIKVHYRGKLTDGTVFDSSFERGDPIEFELGSGQVIPGWDQGLLGACVGEKRKLKIPSKLGYGDNGSPPKIPGGATLIFDTELVAVNGKPSSEGKTKNEL